MQGVTRNPLADPGILGVNAGAALFVVIGIYWFGVTSLLGYVWFAFAGAAVASVVVYVARLARPRGRDAGQARPGRRGDHRVARLDHDGDPADRRRHARPVPLLGRRLAGRARRRRSPPSRAVHRRRLRDGARLRAACSTRSRSATTSPARSASASAWRASLGARRHRAAVRRGDRGRRADRVRRAHRPARRPGDHRARLPLDPPLLGGAGADPAARRRRHRPGHRPARRGAGRHRHRA